MNYQKELMDELCSVHRGCGQCYSSFLCNFVAVVEYGKPSVILAIFKIFLRN